MGTPHGLTHAQPACGVQRQALGTLAAEGAGGVEATPIETDAGEHLALVHIWVVADKGRDEGWGLPGAGSSGPKLSLGRWQGTVPASGAGALWGRPGYQDGESLSISKDFREGPQAAPLTPTRPRAARGGRRRGNYLHTRAPSCGQSRGHRRGLRLEEPGPGEESLPPSRLGGPLPPQFSEGHPGGHRGRAWETPRSPSGALPISQRPQGLPQAAPRVAQHADRKVAPSRFASQRPSWTFSQQVPLVLSGDRGHLAHLPAAQLQTNPRRPSLPHRGGGTQCWAAGPLDPCEIRDLSPRHTVPEGPSRLPGAHSQA